MPKRAKNINEVEYDKIRLLLNKTDLTARQVAAVVGRSPSSILYIKNSKNWDDYREKTIARYSAANAKARSTHGSLTTTPSMPGSQSAKMPKINLGLETLANNEKFLELFERGVEALEKIAYSVEELKDISKKKKGIFS